MQEMLVADNNPREMLVLESDQFLRKVIDNELDIFQTLTLELVDNESNQYLKSLSRQEIYDYFKKNYSVEDTSLLDKASLVILLVKGLEKKAAPVKSAISVTV